MFKVGVGIGEGSDDYSVGVMAVSNAIKQLRDDGAEHIPDAVLVFGSSTYDLPVVIKGIRSVLGEDVLLAGASTAGEITQAGPTARESVVVMLLASDTIRFSTAVAEDLQQNPEAAGKSVAEELNASSAEKPELIMMFADGLRGNASAVLKGILSVVGQTFPVVGGSAGDNGHFVETKQLHNGNVYTNAVAALGMGGEIAFSVGVNHGWSPVGAPRTVTAAEGAKLITVDDKPAFEFYKEYLGEDEAENLKKYTLGEVALSYPLGMYDKESGKTLLRAPFSVDEDGSVICGGEIPVGSKVQLMMGARETAVAAAKAAAETAYSNFEGTLSAAIIFSCHVRNTLFAESESAREEIAVISQALGDDIPIAGFYTYAEQAPFGDTTQNIKKCNPEFHNETVVVVLLGEST